MWYVEKMRQTDMQQEHEFQAFVYDFASRTQMIYINGIVNVSRSAAGPYLGTSG